jgi:hypothetical protein
LRTMSPEQSIFIPHLDGLRFDDVEAVFFVQRLAGCYPAAALDQLVSV